MPIPAGTEQFFEQLPSITVQLVNDAGMCWGSQFYTFNTTKNSGTRFTAKRP
jgi:hypothetical protein